MHTVEAVTEDLQAKVRAMAGSHAAKAAWAEIARRTGLTAGQVKRLHYGEWRSVPAHVFLKITDAYGMHLRAAEARAVHQAQIARALAREWDATWGASEAGVLPAEYRVDRRAG